MPEVIAFTKSFMSRENEHAFIRVTANHV
ncbi:hypothetical protein FOXB_11268 [Fusarium oxysporum f. sp. conglutinans Fo5176]|uniref:Uncharacterized protein n=1 Tax=Fusarium oxysporum (strain Fo5176) TaxID=660025 RepID=F9FXY6_FUSOF|nr:hypothetical protein FOXB_11268 [Fusarium oxysporum f. sp. conglutinans Fo5176]